jgi:signal peptidase II
MAEEVERRSRSAGARGLALFAAVTAVGLAADLGSKAAAFAHVGRGEEIVLVPGFFGLVRSQNIGAAFGMFEGKVAFLIAIAVGALGLLSWFSWTARPRAWAYQVALGLVGAGVIGNLYDRLMFGSVRDFLRVHVDYAPVAQKLFQWFGTNTWPIFNVADALICVGAAALVVKFWRDDRREREAARAAPSGGAARG